MAIEVNLDEKIVPESRSNPVTVDLNNETRVVEEADAIFHSIVNEGIAVAGDHGISHKDIQIGSTALDLAKLRDGQAFYHSHFTSGIWVIFLFVVSTYPIQRIWSIILRGPDYSTDSPALLARAFRSLSRANTWFVEGIENQLSQNALDLYKVRKIHAAALKELVSLKIPPPRIPKNDYTHVLDGLRSDLKTVHVPDYLAQIVTPSPSVPFSQFDMLIILCMFFVLLDTNPEYFGLFLDDGDGDRGYESYVYFVGAIGRYLGMHDRFNIALHPSPAVRKAVSQRIIDDMIKPCYKVLQKDAFQNYCFYLENTVLGARAPWLLQALQLLINGGLKIRPSALTWAHTRRRNKIIHRIGVLLLSLLRYRRPCRQTANFVFKLILRAGVWWFKRGEAHAAPINETQGKGNTNGA